MTTPIPTDLSFPAGELERALSEQSFGIASYEITERSALEAAARVVLLEGEVVSISLTSRGYTSASSASAYESLDDLFQAASERYRAARQRALFAKIAALQ